MSNNSPVFRFYPDTFTHNTETLQSAFKKRMKRFSIGYSFKTNPHPYVLLSALSNGCYAEVVSPYEYSKAISIGFDESRIIYNGVCKDTKQALSCINNGGIVNVDSLAELMDIDNYARGNINIGVRLTFDVENGIVSRFGIPINSKEFGLLVDIDRHCDHIHIVGLSCHITHARSVDEWRTRAKIMASAAEKFKCIKYIDLGGNMYSPMSDDFGNNFPNHVTFEEYAEAICPILSSIDAELILEAGTPLVANAVDISCTVENIKRNDGETFVIVDTSSFDIGIVCRHTKLPYHIEHTKDCEKVNVEHASVVGYTCIEDDVICDDFTDEISVGDRIVFHNVGAYSLSFASDFIKPSPEMEIVRSKRKDK